MADESTPAPVTREVATTQDGRDITKGWVTALELLRPEDEVLMRRGGGDLRIYEELKRDDQVAGTWGQRQDAVVQAEWYVEAGGERRQDQKAAELLREQLQRINFDAKTKKMHYGIFYGYAVGECMWAREGSRVVLDDIRVRNRRRFGFDGAGRLRLRTASDPMGELLPERKFWVYSAGADHDDDPYGLGLGHYLYWPVYFKRSEIRLWLIFLDKFGQPTARGKYPQNATEEEKRRLLDALNAIHTESGVIVPEGMDIELIEAARSGSADYSSLYDRMDRAITKIILGHTGGSESTPGKLGGEDMAEQVRADIIKADADVICESFNRSVARWLTEWNFPGAAVPRVWRTLEEPEDLNKLAERDTKISQLGFKPTLQYVRETYGEGWEPAPQQPGSAAPAFAEGEEKEVSEQLADNLESRAGEAIGAMIEPVRRLVEQSGSLEEVKRGLEEIFEDVPEDRFAEIMREAIAAARLAGMYEVSEGGE